jgi:hypothetical protein
MKRIYAIVSALAVICITQVPAPLPYRLPPSREQSRRWAAYKAYITEVNRRSSKEEPTE